MAGIAENVGGRFGSRWRIAAWAVAAFILLLPLVAMQFTDEVNWDVADFAVAGDLLVGTGITYELAVRRTGDSAYRAAVGVALAAAFILVWMSLAVGIIGSEGDPANLMYFGVFAAGIIGAIIARFRPHGMARALIATALAQVLVAVIALMAGLGAPASGPGEILLLNGFFVALFVGSALLFRRAAKGGPEWEKLMMHKLIPVLTIAIGLVLMMAKIYADSEPGAIPILLVVIGMGWYFISRVRTQSQHK